eukprot:503020-Pleurochrysis_carterae.AAC.7
MHARGLREVTSFESIRRPTHVSVHMHERMRGRKRGSRVDRDNEAQELMRQCALRTRAQPPTAPPCLKLHTRLAARPKRPRLARGHSLQFVKA